MAIRHQAV
ncbi:unnamed protein product [Linum tenue]|uniref:Uncharacterized protein n=1 Tax=Linum tenue TaxID=586396 RepID=A0AAV0RJN0_9ROSI|nr:unnamed protein product [Linum tenue]